MQKKKKTYTAKKKRWHQKRYQTRFENGLCPMCGGKRTGEWIICAVCLEKARDSRAKNRTLEGNRRTTNRYRAKCRKEGICYGCGREIGVGEYTRCPACRDKDRVSHNAAYRRKVLAEPLVLSDYGT